MAGRRSHRASPTDLGNDPDGDFDELDRIEAIAQAGAAPDIGDKVRIIAGRHRGSTGTLVDLGIAVTPSGSGVGIAVVKRPRAGETHVFSHEIERA